MNIHSNLWEQGSQNEVSKAQRLLEVAAELGVKHVEPGNPGPTYFPDDLWKRALVIDLIFIKTELILTVPVIR